MCGIFSIYGKEQSTVAQDVYDGLISLQHRGHDACGILTYDEHSFHLKKGIGFVRDNFHAGTMRRLTGNLGIGHIRYATVGKGGLEDAQPFYVHHPYGIAMAHNGNLSNFLELKKELVEKDLWQVNSGCDVEVILAVFAQELAKQNSKTSKMPEKVFAAVQGVYKRCKGAYSVTGIIAGYGLFGFRDPYGIRPMIFGKRGSGKQAEYAFTSESVMFNMMGLEYVKDVGAGECIFIDSKRVVHTKQIASAKLHPCIFEYVYFSRPDSLENNISVYKARLRMGEILAKRIKPLQAKLKIDVVIPAPSTSNTAALALAHDLGVKYREGLVKNNFIGRTFIMPGQAKRVKSVKYKLNPQPLEIKRKNVLLVDDSIVRGTTAKEIVQMLRAAGAKKVYVASASSPVVSPCLYGVDIPTRQELIANHKDNESIRKYIGADWLIYQTIEDMVKAVNTEKSLAQKFCTGCFSKKYPTADITEQVIAANEKMRLEDKAACTPINK
ncbi:MAG: amidophosphoribosyltransferase [Patescibacteria group bacterium]|jgi:amidophosphoribosyltransferase